MRAEATMTITKAGAGRGVAGGSAGRGAAGRGGEAKMAVTKAGAWMAMPGALEGIGSPKTMMPPAMQLMFAAVPVMAMTGTASPSCSERAEASEGATAAAG